MVALHIGLVVLAHHVARPDHRGCRAHEQVPGHPAVPDRGHALQPHADPTAVYRVPADVRLVVHDPVQPALDAVPDAAAGHPDLVVLDHGAEGVGDIDAAARVL